MGFSGGPNQCMHGWAVEAACQLLGPHSNWQEDVTTVGKLLRQDQSPTIVEDAIVPMEHLWCSPMVPQSPSGIPSVVSSLATTTSLYSSLHGAHISWPVSLALLPCSFLYRWTSLYSQIFTSTQQRVTTRARFVYI
jgi:hypothetical protein